MAATEPRADRHRMTDVWPLVHAERAALAADLADLTDEQWATPSLCTELTVREVLAHLTAGASLNSVRWLAGVVRCRFDFDKQVAMRLAEQLGATPAETLERFRRIVTARPNRPCRPSRCSASRSCTRRTSDSRWGSAATTRSPRSPGWPSTTRVPTSWSPPRGASAAYDSSPVTDPSRPAPGRACRAGTLALTMAMTGRTAYCDQLEGDGVAILRDRGKTA